MYISIIPLLKIGFLVPIKLLMHTMNEKKIFRKLQKEPAFNPFHPKFDFKIILEFVNDINGTVDIETIPRGDYLAIMTCLTTTFFNPLFDETYIFFKKQIETSNLSVKEIFAFLFAIINRNYLSIHNRILKDGNNGKDLQFLDSFKHKIDSMDKSIGKVGSIDVLESAVDNLNKQLNYLRYFKENTLTKTESKYSELDSVNNMIKLNLSGSFFSIIKDHYEDAIWNRGFLLYKSDAKVIVIGYHSEDEQKLLKAGHLRLLKNVFGSHINNLTTIGNTTLGNTTISNLFKKYKLPKRIKSVGVENGFLTYKLSKGIDKNEIKVEWNLFGELSTFYPFIGNVELPNFKDLDLFKLIAMFAAIQSLFSKAIFQIKIQNNEVKEIKDFYKFPFKIKVMDIRNYLKSRFNFSLRQINGFLSLLEIKFTKEKRIDLWDKPFVKYNEEYYFSLIGINDSMILHLLDIWLNDGGFSLDKRGYMLEDYLKKQLSYQIKIKGYKVLIPTKSEFHIKGKGKEEIDLIINLERVLIIAEVKCIKYPMDSRDYHNAYKRLEKASNQVVRKEKFIKNNIDFFDKEFKGIRGKKVVTVVVTNFPNFSGFLINSVPVVDLFMLESYVISGQFSTKKIQFTKKGEVEQEPVGNTKYYTNETEFSENFETIMKSYPPIEKLKGSIEIVYNKKSLKESEIDVYVMEPNII